MSNDTKMIFVKDIDFNEFNPNQLTDEKFSSLKESIKKDGIQHPVIVRYKGKRFEMIDGENRTKIAKEFKIKELEAIVKTVDDVAAMRLCYKLNSDRGTIDCFKEAVFFDLMKQKGIKDKDTSKEYGFSEKFIRNRRKLLTINQEQKEVLIKNFSKGKEITGAHWVAYADATPEARMVLCKDLSNRSDITVKDIEYAAKRALEKIAEIKRFEKMLKEAKVKDCPVCKKLPVRVSYCNKKHLSCENYHDWHPSTGKTDQKIIGTTYNQAEKKKKPKYPRNIEIKIDWPKAINIAQKYALNNLDQIKNITFLDKKGMEHTVEITRDKGYEGITIQQNQGYVYDLSMRDPRASGIKKAYMRGPQYADIRIKEFNEMIKMVKQFKGKIVDKRVLKNFDKLAKIFSELVGSILKVPKKENKK